MNLRHINNIYDYKGIEKLVESYPNLLNQVVKYQEEIQALSGLLKRPLSAIDTETVFLPGYQISGLPHGNNISDPTSRIALEKIEEINSTAQKHVDYIANNIKSIQEKIGYTLYIRKTMHDWMLQLSEDDQLLVEMRYFLKDKVEVICNHFGIAKNTYISRNKRILTSLSDYEESLFR